MDRSDKHRTEPTATTNVVILPVDMGMPNPITRFGEYVTWLAERQGRPVDEVRAQLLVRMERALVDEATEVCTLEAAHAR